MNAFQWIVDESQQQPYWWCRQAAKVLATSTAISFLVQSRPWDAKESVAAFLAAIFCGMLYLVSSNARTVALLASSTTLKNIYWVLLALQVLRCGLLGIAPERAADFVSVLAMVAFCEFALCRPPAPPRRRVTRMARGSA